ncbi:uncharacterized protein B0P05DRAFT_18594 [Gilbertella persicaria]|uniref:uncharacterized protein n=1 Tax=Gilbertella persicaria TaxID=101096 RepID=UPI00221E4075|nr:uncharacterized protein B0P05DRAFT_18594 [Gilbertella persicaria]KAI8087001.1 hypothetical protein B0P05DRAFT_18594 [Gilbertella persicaria]
MIPSVSSATAAVVTAVVADVVDSVAVDPVATAAIYFSLIRVLVIVVLFFKTHLFSYRFISITDNFITVLCSQSSSFFHSFFRSRLFLRLPELFVLLCKL